jgi:hypothetical protein
VGKGGHSVSILMLLRSAVPTIGCVVGTADRRFSVIRNAAAAFAHLRLRQIRFVTPSCYKVI